jgi:PHD/YefM family antitoxin component YafN of YafNO toxin-antitoxin module
MKIASLADVKARLSAYVDECREEGPVVITRNGKPAAVLLVPQNDNDLERLLLEHSPRFQALLDRSRKSILAGKGLPEKDFWAAVHNGSRDQRSREEGSPPVKNERTTRKRRKP